MTESEGEATAMAWYRVELRGEAREVYSVEADSAEEASDKWASGHLEISEASSMEVFSVREDD